MNSSDGAPVARKSLLLPGQEMAITQTPSRQGCPRAALRLRLRGRGDERIGHSRRVSPPREEEERGRRRRRRGGRGGRKRREKGEGRREEGGGRRQAEEGEDPSRL